MCVFINLGGEKIEISHAVEQLHQDILLACKHLINSILIEEVVFDRGEMSELLPDQKHSDIEVNQTGNSDIVVAFHAEEIENVGVFGLHFLQHQLGLVISYNTLFALDCYSEVETGTRVVFGLEHEADG